MSENERLIDLRSDTVTRPTERMRAAMATAEVGDDVFGDDPTVHRLQEIAATTLGTEAALFLPSGTQSNLCALLSHCHRGEEFIVGQTAHTYRYEGGGGAIVGGIQPQPIDFEPDGSLDLNKVASYVKPDDPHFAITRLLCLENTQFGKVLSLDYLQQAEQFCREHALALHLDGARIFNASVKLGVPVTNISRHFDSVSVCLSKGLCAPVGSVLCGNKEFIHRAHRWRKTLGGGMRQAGVLAAAGIIALTEHVDRLAEDHDKAADLAQQLSELDEVTIDPNTVQTNMVFIDIEPGLIPDLVSFLRKHGVIVHAGYNMLRLVTHHDIHFEDISKIVAGFKNFFSKRAAA